jgi:hypothetical protein
VQVITYNGDAVYQQVKQASDLQRRRYAMVAIRLSCAAEFLRVGSTRCFTPQQLTACRSRQANI